jgi:hypothetical protein
MQSAHLDYNGREYGSDVSHYFLTAGYVFDINYEFLNPLDVKISI